MRGKAVIFTDRRKAEYLDVEIPEPGPCDVVIETKYSWISNGTEGSFFRGERIDGETPYYEGGPWPFPICAGYQSTGIVTAVGAEVTRIKKGQWVFGSVGRVSGLYQEWGGEVNPKVCDWHMVTPLPEWLPPMAAAGLVLTQVGYNCGMRPALAPGDTALVIGDGMVGQWAAQTLLWRGARVILTGKHDFRLNLLPEHERALRVNVTKKDLAEAIRELAPEGLQVVVDAAGTVPGMMTCVPFMRHNGHIVTAAFLGTESMIDIQKLRNGELTLHMPSGFWPDRMQATLDLIAAGHLKTLELITHRFPVQQAPQAWKMLDERATEEMLGIILEW